MVILASSDLAVRGGWNMVDGGLFGCTLLVMQLLHSYAFKQLLNTNYLNSIMMLSMIGC